MGELAPEVLEKLEAREGGWSTHAAESRQELGLGWGDVIAVGRSATSWKRETDDQGVALDGWKDSMVGRDTSGREIYMAGKWVYFEEEPCWYVITIRQHRKEKQQRRRRRP